MKKAILVINLLAANYIFAQQWNTNGNAIVPLNFLGSSTGTNTNPIIFKTGNGSSVIEQMRITGGAAGNIGINTTTPTHKLHVNNGAIQVTGNNSWGGPMVVFGPSALGANNETWGIETTTTGLNFFRPWNGQLNQGNYFLFMKHTTGNIGIKTDNPTAGLTINTNVLIGNPAAVNLPSGYRLYVEQGILTEKLKVAVKNTANWADYVFANDYKLKPLCEIETFIKINKHLPGIPTSEEVVKDGIDVAEMNAKLLEKIEELTLHVIHLEKEINQLKQK